MKFSEKKVNTVLITGGNSTVGKDLVNLFLKDNFKVIAIIRKKIKKKKYKKNYKEIHLDYLKSIKIRKKVDFVVNTIATHEYSTNKKLDDYYEGNIKCTKKIVDFCKKKKIKFLINLSTISIYKKKKTETKEIDPVDDESILGPSKFLGEKIIEMSDLNFISLRLPGVLSLDSSLVSRPWLKKIIYDIKKNKKIEIFNQNVKFNSIIDTIEIYNFIKFIFRNKKMISGSYNFSASKPMKLKQIIKIITNFYSYNLKIKYRFINKSSSSLINIKKLDTKNNFKISSTKKILLRYLKNIG